MKHMIFIVLSILVSGTAYATTLSTDTMEITLILKSHPKVYIKTDKAFLEDNALNIQGNVQRRTRNVKKWLPAGHMDLELISPTKKRLASARGPLSPPIIPRKTNNRSSRFTLRVPLGDISGPVTAQLFFHTGQHEQN